MHDAPPDAIVAEGVTKAYGDVVALQPTDLRIRRGELVAVIGHNGSGKSTLLGLCSGRLRPSGGRVSVAGHPAGSDEAGAALSELADAEPALQDELSLWAHLELLAGQHRVSDWEARGEALVTAFGLGERRDDLPVRFSGGMLQKTALVFGLLRPYEVLVADEPFFGLDAGGRAALLDCFTNARAEGRSLLVASHDPRLLALVDRAVALRDGAVVHDGPVEGADVAALTR